MGHQKSVKAMKDIWITPTSARSHCRGPPLSVWTSAIILSEVGVLGFSLMLHILPGERIAENGPSDTCTGQKRLKGPLSALRHHTSKAVSALNRACKLLSALGPYVGMVSAQNQKRGRLSALNHIGQALSTLSHAGKALSALSHVGRVICALNRASKVISALSLYGGLLSALNQRNRPFSVLSQAGEAFSALTRCLSFSVHTILAIALVRLNHFE